MTSEKLLEGGGVLEGWEVAPSRGDLKFILLLCYLFLPEYTVGASCLLPE